MVRFFWRVIFAFLAFSIATLIVHWTSVEVFVIGLAIYVALLTYDLAEEGRL